MEYPTHKTSKQPVGFCELEVAALKAVVHWRPKILEGRPWSSVGAVLPFSTCGLWLYWVQHLEYWVQYPSEGAGSSTSGRGELKKWHTTKVSNPKFHALRWNQNNICIFNQCWTGKSGRGMPVQTTIMEQRSHTPSRILQSLVPRSKRRPSRVVAVRRNSEVLSRLASGGDSSDLWRRPNPSVAEQEISERKGGASPLSPQSSSKLFARCWALIHFRQRIEQLRRPRLENTTNTEIQPRQLLSTFERTSGSRFPLDTRRSNSSWYIHLNSHLLKYTPRDWPPARTFTGILYLVALRISIISFHPTLIF